MLRRTLLHCLMLVVVCVTAKSVNSQNPDDLLDTVRERIANRSLPSVFQMWGGPGWRAVLNRDDIDDYEAIALHDVYAVNGFGGWGVQYNSDSDTLELNPDKWLTRVGKSEIAKLRRINPNILVLLSIGFNHGILSDQFPPESSPFWLRDDDGELIKVDYVHLADFTHPESQRMIINLAVSAYNSGVIDGVFFDSWGGTVPVLPGYKTIEEERQPRINILQGIRDRTHPDFLIMCNTNDRKIPYTVDNVNIAFMETHPFFPDDKYGLPQMAHLEHIVRWMKNNLREPQMICFEARYRPSVDGVLPEPVELANMRMLTTFVLTFTDGAILYAIGLDGDHNHNWYDFWDADLGQPVGRKYTGYNPMLAGFYIREFTNGWVVYNRRNDSQRVEFDIPVVGVSSEQFDYVHEIPARDGEIYLKSHATKVNPRDLLTTQWGKLKQVK